MFEATMYNKAYLSGSFAALKEVGVEKMDMDVFEDGIHLQGMEKSGISFASVYFGHAAFESIRCDQPCRITVNVARFLKVLKLIGGEDNVCLRAGSTAPDSLEVTFKGANTQGIFNFNLLETTTGSLNIPSWTDDASSLDIMSERFSTIVSETAEFGDMITIEIEQNKQTMTFIGFSAKGTGLVTINKGPDVQITAKESTSVKIPVQMLKRFMKGKSLAKVVRISFTSNSPVLVEYGLNEDAGFVRFYLAPIGDE